MKHHDVYRPVGKCKGCCLNLRTYCAAGLPPKDQWDGRRCKHYGDAVLLKDIQRRPGPSGAKLARLRRKAKAEAAATEPHHDGVLDPGKMAGRSKRHGH